MLDTIRAKRDEIYAAAKKNRAEKLWVFGSVARKQERPDSDVDFLVEFNDQATLLDHGRLYNVLSAMFGRGVDVVDRGGVRQGSIFSKMIERDMVAVCYDGVGLAGGQLEGYAGGVSVADSLKGRGF